MRLSPYAEGFYAGIRYQRDNILDYVSIHEEQGYTVTSQDIVDEINGQYKRDMNAKVNAMMDGSIDKLIRNLDELSYTVSNIERQAQEIAAEVTKKL
jgi:2-hydroxy-3-keto-5-methylthiopentenyl-1-phosphate phosphatase